MDLDSHLSVTDRCRSLVHILRVGPVAAGAKASALCEGSMPGNSERQIQSRFKFVCQGHFAEKSKKADSMVRQGPLSECGPGLSPVCDRQVQVTVPHFRVGPLAAGPMASALCERSMPDWAESLIQARFEVCSPEHFAKIARKPDSVFRQGPLFGMWDRTRTCL